MRFRPFDIAFDTTLALIVVLVLSIPIATHYGAYKHGRKVMYSQICEQLGVTEAKPVRAGKSLIFKQGIFTPAEPRPIPRDICNMCHIGGY